MKVFVYGYRKEEAAYFSACAKAMQLEIDTCAQRPTLENAQLCQSYECISVLSTPIDAALLQKLQEVGVRFLSTRTVGYDHIDLAYARKIGIHIGNAPMRVRVWRTIDYADSDGAAQNEADFAELRSVRIIPLMRYWAAI